MNAMARHNQQLRFCLTVCGTTPFRRPKLIIDGGMERLLRRGFACYVQ